MKKTPFRLLASCFLLLASCRAQALLTGNAQHGEELFKTQHCVMCHAVNGQGGKTAPDLGRISGRAYTPADMASLMWNHAPLMWAAMAKEGVTKPSLDAQQAADLFAYFYSARYFDKPGDAARGKQVFTSKRCAACHASGLGQPPSSWQIVNDPILLAAQMWNHGADMRGAFQSKGFKWPELSSQDLTDLLVYVQNLPENRVRAARLEPAATPENGQALFQSKGCVGCHTGKLALENRYLGRTLTDFAVAMWNHEPKMKNPPPPLTGPEMRAVVGYLWTAHLFSTKGNPTRGKKLFAEKRCTSCHNESGTGAPNLAALKGKFEPFFIVSALWEHGPAMERQMRQKNIPWPRFNGSDMSDLMAFLNK